MFDCHWVKKMCGQWPITNPPENPFWKYLLFEFVHQMHQLDTFIDTFDAVNTWLPWLLSAELTCHLRKHGNRTAIAGRGCTDRPKKNLGDCFGGIAYVAYGLGKTRAMCN